MNGQTNFYTVKKGDALWKIAKENGTTVESLTKINSLKSANKIAVGQRIALRPEAVCGIEALFLDRDRNSIKDLVYRIERCGKIFNGITGENGKTKSLLTETPDDPVKIWVKRLDGSWKLVTTVVSGFGNKLVTLISGHMMVQATTEKHPDLPPNTKPKPKERQKPLHDKRPAPTTDKKELGLKVTPVKTPNGKPLTKVEGDIPALDFLDEYSGEVMTDADYEWAARELGVEKAVIKAFAVVESEGSGFSKIGTRDVPKILYERHKFSKKTSHQYSAKYPDISLPNAYYNANTKYVFADAEYKKLQGVPDDVDYYRPIRKKGKNKDSEEVEATSVTLGELLKSGKATVEQDKYASVPGSYRRLVKAYQLNPNAALESCSWGSFQIMGEYWGTMKYASVKEFTRAMSRSPKEQIKAFVRYIEHVNPRVKKHLKNHDWAGAAAAYNGPGYKNNNYDVKLEAAYKKYKDEK